MPVYKAMLKIANKIKWFLFIYIGISIFFSVLFTINHSDNGSTFEQTKSRIAFINEDENSTLLNGLKDYLNDKAEIVDLPNDTQSLQDALFYQEVNYIVRVPVGYTEALLNDREKYLDMISVPNSTTGIYMNLLIDQYLNTTHAYIRSGLTDEAKLVQNVSNDLSKETEVMLKNQLSAGSNVTANIYFNFMAYALIGTFIIGIGALVNSFNQSDMKKRNLAAPLTPKQMNSQVLLGYFTFAAITWVILLIPSFIMYADTVISRIGLLTILNSLICAVTMLSIGFLIASLVSSMNALSAIANVVALGSGFICGVFVPQFLLGNTVLLVASFFPMYWYVKANDQIFQLSNFTFKNLQPIYIDMLIQLGFAITLFTVALVVIKTKREKV